jgi:hypothetical protein
MRPEANNSGEASMSQLSTGDQTARSPEAIYRRRCDDFGRQRDAYARRSAVNGNVSVGLAAAAVILLGLWFWRGQPWLLTASGVLWLAFAISFIHHGRVNATLRRFVELYAFNAEGLARLRRDWDALPLRQPAETARQRQPKRAASGLYGQIFAPFASATAGVTDTADADETGESGLATDLDLLGRASLQHLLNTPATPVGLATTRDWLLAPAAHAVARARQAAAAELAPLNDFRDQVALRGRLEGWAQASSTERTYERFLRWAEGEPWLPRRAWLLWLARGLPLLALVLGLAQLAGLFGQPLWLAPAAVGVVLTATICRRADMIIDEVAERQSVFATYAEIFQLVAAQPFAAPMLRALQGSLAAGHLRADQQMRRLSRLMALADLRGWMFFYPIQILTLWNVHVLWLLERWLREAGGSARRWLATLGEIEALAALATLSHDNPTWAFPDLVDHDPQRHTKDTKDKERAYDNNSDIRVPSCDSVDSTLAATNLGHPLLPPEVCVGNDVAVGPPGSFLLVTGSNMSGKSTLLRSIGVNVTLAQAGGPVCAAAMRLPPVALATSMRVQDSLEQGVSYFMAELRRLKQVVGMAERERAQGQRVLVFLLDEMLHGTNTAERQIAARRIILHLLALGATGAVSTHDLALADAPELAGRAVTVHFSEQFVRGDDGLAMRFDYRLRPGVATSTNALKLMEMLGLPA